MSISDEIQFEEVITTDPITREEMDAVAVIRNGRQVAVLPEVDRLRRALSLPLVEIRHIIDNFPAIMNREPTRDESEFWRAVLDFKRSQG